MKGKLHHGEGIEVADSKNILVITIEAIEYSSPQLECIVISRGLECGYESAEQAYRATEQTNLFLVMQTLIVILQHG